ncbi:MAG: DUF4340 domain-containing protein [Myxococcota bacterium]|nr:DUF4340 domain-containing protein [Myxococcota bacterium]MDW8363102.1 DUF4340 domain-containing protein [Myxococcales bacterium]
MKPRTVVLLGAVAAGLFAFIWFWERHQISTSELSSRHERLLRRFVRARCDQVQIEVPGRPRIVLERERAEEDELGDWKLVEPVRAHADEDAVDTLLGAVEWADARRNVGLVDEAQLRRFGLHPPRLVARFRVGRETVELHLGGEEPRGAGVYARVGGEPEVRVVGSDLLESLDRDATALRSKELFGDFGAWGAERVRLVRSGGAQIALGRRDGTWWLEAPVRSVAATSTVEGMLRALDELRAARFVEERPQQPARYGLEPPALEVQLQGGEGNEGRRSASLRLGGPCEGHAEERYARRDEGPVVCVRASAVTALERDVEALRDRRLLVLADDEIERVEIERSGAPRIELRREGSGWKLRSGEAEPREADAEAVEAWFEALRRSTASAFVPATPSEPVTLTLKLHRVDERPALAVALVRRTDGWSARRGDEAEWMQLQPSERELFDALDWRFVPHRMLELRTDEARALRVTRGTVTERLERDGELWRLLEPVSVAAERVAVADALQTLSPLRAERVVAGTPRAEHGLQAPALEIAVEVRPPSEAASNASGQSAPSSGRTHVIRVGPLVEGRRFARVDEGPVFVAPSLLYERFAEPFVNRSLLATSSSALESVRIEQGHRVVELVRDAERWIARAGPAPDESATRRLVDTLASLRARTVRFERLALRAVSLRLRVRRTEEPREMVLLVGTTGAAGAPPDTVPAAREDLPLLFFIERADAQALALGSAR